jgi:dihydropteroate synthase
MSIPEPAPIRVRGRCLEWGQRTYVMSILNITPDSFSATGPGLDPDAALRRARQDLADGADLLDVGGESTRPGATPVDADTELRRVMPVIERLVAETSALISIDTTKPEVADAALRAGAAILNDIHGLRGDRRMATVAARHGAPVVAMANLRDCRYTDVVEAVLCQFRESLSAANAAGIASERVILDPGFGFGPAPQENLELIRRLHSFRRLGRPLLIGTSRKSTIGRVLDLPVEERLEGTAATVAVSIVNGVDIVRVHETRPKVRVVRMTDAIVRGWRGPEPAADGASV